MAICAISALIRLHDIPGFRDEIPSNSASKISAAPIGKSEDEKAIFNQYGGSASCVKCHREEFNSWKTSHHALAERAIDPALDTAAFEPSRTVSNGAEVQIKNGQFEFSTDIQGARKTFFIQRVIGHEPLRQFLVSFPGGRFQTLADSYDPRSNEWFNVFSDGRKPGEWGHWTGRGMNWNSMCAACHNTRVRKNYDATADSYHTTMAEATVGCEACHGPLKAHDEWQEKFGNTGAKDPTLKKLSRNQMLETCASCHSRRSDLTGDFEPGDSFHDHFGLAKVDYSDGFYPDGQIHEEDYEYAAFLGSRMHFRGVTCADCHNPHSLKTILPGNLLCMRCHNGSYANAPVINPVIHSHHRVFGYDSKGALTNFDVASYIPAKIRETGGECVNCHMPQTVYMQRHWRHDHGFTIPDPLLTKKFNVPNACNRCHQDQNADWSLDWVEKWYGKKMERLTRERAEWIARAKNGDPAARDGLLNLLGREEIPYWRAVEAGMLSPWASDVAVRNALMKSLNDTNEMVRVASIRSLASLVENGFTNVVEAIQTKLHDPARDARIAAAWALRRTLDSSLPAARELQRYLDFNSDQPGGQLQSGVYSFSKNDFQAARIHLEKAVAWDPGSPAWREEFAVVLSSLDQPKAAVEQLKKAVEIAPRDSELHYKLGLAYHESGELNQTVAELKTAVQLDSRNANAWYNLGLAENELGQTADAIESLLRAESVSPNDSRIPYARATILARAGNFAEARAAAKRALEIQPGFADAQNLLDQLPR
jgi:tetratricopeptide (TPR) repeat protein